VQDDDLHMANLYARAGRLRVLDRGDASISHPFASLVVTFRFLEEVTGLAGRPVVRPAAEAYLQPWGSGLSTAPRSPPTADSHARHNGTSGHPQAVVAAVG